MARISDLVGRIRLFLTRDGNKMQNGIVKWFNDQKGFGFVASQGQDFFIHFKEIQSDGFKTLKEGDKVKFTPEQSTKGPVCKGLTLGHLD